MSEIVVETDRRGRCNLLKVGGRREAYYFAHQERDGTIILNPAGSMKISTGEGESGEGI